MIDYSDPNFDPNIIANMDPSDWDMDSHALAIQGGFEDAIDSHVQNTGQLPDQDQTAAYMRQAIQDQLPFMTKQTQQTAEDGQAATDTGAGTNGGGSHLEFPMPPDPGGTGKDHLEWPMPPAPETSETPETPETPAAAQDGNTPPNQPQPSLPPISPQPKTPALKGPFISQKTGDDIIKEAAKNGGYLATQQDIDRQHEHECTALTKYATGAGQTSDWVEGEKLSPEMLDHLQPGTAIATFTKGHYVNAPGNHAAVVNAVHKDGPDAPRIDVVEQYEGQEAHENRFYYNKPGDPRIKNMANYSVILSH